MYSSTIFVGCEYTGYYHLLTMGGMYRSIFYVHVRDVSLLEIHYRYLSVCCDISAIPSSFSVHCTHTHTQYSTLILILIFIITLSKRERYVHNAITSPTEIVTFLLIMVNHSHFMLLLLNKLHSHAF